MPHPFLFHGPSVPAAAGAPPAPSRRLTVNPRRRGDMAWLQDSSSDKWRLPPTGLMIYAFHQLSITFSYLSEFHIFNALGSIFSKLAPTPAHNPITENNHLCKGMVETPQDLKCLKVLFGAPRINTLVVEAKTLLESWKMINGQQRRQLYAGSVLNFHRSVAPPCQDLFRMRSRERFLLEM